MAHDPDANARTRGMKIRWIRAAAGLTQEQLADVLGCAARAIGQWEQGQAAPRRMSVYALAKFCDIPFDEFDAWLRGDAPLTTLPRQMREWYQPTQQISEQTVADLRRLLLGEQDDDADNRR